MRIFFLLLLSCAFLSGEILPRKIVVPWGGREDRDLFHTKAHQLAEMPLNHLGFVCDYIDLHSPLPDTANDPSVQGILLWLTDQSDLNREEAERLMEWAEKAVRAGKKLVMFGKPPFESNKYILSAERIAAFFSIFGLQYKDEWVPDTYKVELIKVQPELVDFERAFPAVLPSYIRVVAEGETENVLIAQKNGDESTQASLITLGKRASYVAFNYGNYFLYERGETQRNWYINPFLFFRRAFGVGEGPIPDTNTLCGSRIYYSHVDGDGWNNETEIGDYPWGTLSAQVLRERILEEFPDMPVTIGPIAADVDPSWVGTEKSIRECQKILVLPNVETSSHTFTHPFDWRFFEHYRKSKEYPYLSLYPNGSWMGRGLLATLRLKMRWITGDPIESEEVPLGDRGLYEEYDVPRAFALKPFDLDLEINGSIEVINALASEKKPVALYQWSGNCQPFEAAMRLLDQMEMPNMNGGDTRFDKTFNSYGFIFPLGRQVGPYWQIYSSNTNENLYTDLWRARFWGFNQLPETFAHTETPIRVKPMNLYYHVYSAQKEPSLQALLSNIAYIRSKEVCSIKAGEYPAIVEGFYALSIEREGDLYTIRGRKGLQTLRFDRASTKAIDFKRSKGVIGQRYFQGSLYAALDPAVEEVQVALTENPDFPHEARSRFCLESSTWQVSHVEGTSFQASGYGQGRFVWHVPEEGEYTVTAEGQEPIRVRSVNRRIRFAVPGSIPKKLTFKVERNGS
ncbi:MAG: hypothetical protein KDK48_00015 [Chlamydiia bacterium]|nr:hypothetical protein [Chlamydiia bacterium]